MPAPCEALQQIDWQRPVEMEIGCGTGDWVMGAAAQNPDIQYIAVERSHERSGKLLRRATHAGLRNLHAVQADAVWLCHFLVPASSIDALYFHFPNPYPKRGQANLRFFSGPAFHVFDRVLKPGGKIVAASNIADYINEAALFLREIWGYTVTQQVRDAALPPRTAFEKKYQGRGLAIYEVLALKPDPSLRSG